MRSGWHKDSYRHYLAAKYGFAGGKEVNQQLNQDFRVTKHAAGYVEGKKNYSCGNCVHFSKGNCALVQGPVKAAGCCNLWQGEGKIDYFAEKQ